MIFNPVGLQARQTGSSIRMKVLLRTMLLDTTAHQDILIKQALRCSIAPLREIQQGLQIFQRVRPDRLAAGLSRRHALTLKPKASAIKVKCSLLTNILPAARYVGKTPICAF